MTRSRRAMTGLMLVGVWLPLAATSVLGESPPSRAQRSGFSFIESADAQQMNVLMGSEEIRDDPGDLMSYRTQSNLGKSFHFRVTGATSGPVWGSELYTDDSRLAAAAVHAGAVALGETAVVRVTILPGRNSYRGETRHGVDSSRYGPWPGSYMVESAGLSPRDEEIPSAPATLSGVEGKIGDSFVYRATGSTQGSVWGVEVYTDDSSIAAAAVHAGVLAEGETGLIRVTILPGRTFYNGLQRNGVTSSTWDAFERSFMIDRVQTR